VPERGMAALEQRLAGHGFLRVHRHYLVNPARVMEMVPGSNGSIWLVLDVPAGPELMREILARTLISAWLFGGFLMLAALARGAFASARMPAVAAAAKG